MPPIEKGRPCEVRAPHVQIAYGCVKEYWATGSEVWCPYHSQHPVRVSGKVHGCGAAYPRVATGTRRPGEIQHHTKALRCVVGQVLDWGGLIEGISVTRRSPATIIYKSVRLLFKVVFLEYNSCNGNEGRQILEPLVN